MFAFLAFFMILVPVAMFHETGHVVVCDLQGGYGIYTSIVTSACYDNNYSHTAIMRFAGGGFGAAVSLIPLTLWGRLKDNPVYRGILIGFLSMAFWNFEMAILESSNFAFYASHQGDYLMSTGALAVGVVLYVLLGRPKKVKDSKSIDLPPP